MEALVFVTFILVVITIGVGIYLTKCEVSGKRAKKILGMNLSTFILLLIATTIVMFSGNHALASGTEGIVDSNLGLGLIAAALSTGLACIGAGIAVAVSASAAIGAISENEKLLGKSIIFVGLAEGIAIYGLIISIMIIGKV